MKRIVFFNLLFSLSLLSVAQFNNAVLDANEVHSKVYANGTYFNGEFSFPSFGPGTIYSFANWIGAYDQNGDLHMSVQQGEHQFLPGPIIDIQTPSDSTTANAYNHVWMVTQDDIYEFNAEFAQGNVTNGSYTVPEDILNWPGNHPFTGEEMAPYVDVNMDGVYDALDGDYPRIKGCKMLWWIYNDNVFPFNNDWKPLGVEFRASYYAFQYENAPDEQSDAINYITFLDIEVVNRSDNDYDSLWLGFQTDFGIGDWSDDNIQSHVDFSSFYGFNNDGIDGSGGMGQWGGPTPPPPAQGFTILKGPEADINDGIDNDHDGSTDEPGECWSMSNFMLDYGQVGPLDTVLTKARTYYNLMSSRYYDGSKLVYGLGHVTDPDSTDVFTNFMYPWDSDPTGWAQGGLLMPSWENPATPVDRSGVGSCGPVSFETEDKLTVHSAFTFARAETGDHMSSVTKLFDRLDLLHQWYAAGSFPTSCNIYSLKEDIQDEIVFDLYPNPASDLIRLETNINSWYSVSIYNLLGEKVLEITHIGEPSFVLNLGKLNAGVYMVKLNDGDRQQTKLIVLR